MLRQISIARVAACSLAVCCIATSVLAADVNVRDAGAVGDGEHLETASINSAIQRCHDSGGGRVILPPGKYLTGTVRLLGAVTLEIPSGATVLASQRAQDYTQV